MAASTNLVTPGRGRLPGLLPLPVRLPLPRSPSSLHAGASEPTSPVERWSAGGSGSGGRRSSDGSLGASGGSGGSGDSSTGNDTGSGEHRDSSRTRPARASRATKRGRIPDPLAMALQADCVKEEEDGEADARLLRSVRARITPPTSLGQDAFGSFAWPSLPTPPPPPPLSPPLRAALQVMAFRAVVRTPPSALTQMTAPGAAASPPLALQPPLLVLPLPTTAHAGAAQLFPASGVPVQSFPLFSGTSHTAGAKA
ncbi:unnamed protein product [Phaeothamnion confervicola]